MDSPPPRASRPDEPRRPPPAGSLRGSARLGALVGLGVVLVGGAFVLAAPREAPAPAVPTMLRAPTAHQAHRLSIEERHLKGTALGDQWLAESDRAISDPVAVRSPYVEEGRFIRPEADAVGYRVDVARGQRLEVRLGGTLVDSGDLLVDLYRLPPESSGETTATSSGETTAKTSTPLHPTRVRSLRTPGSDLDLEPEEDGTYVLRIQPKLFSEGTYRVSLRTVPALLFPVVGRDNSAVWSGFGAPREGGRRDHHGIDIFADRGTPALAATDAYVRRVDITPIGGKVVWLRDRDRNISIYYAHLDSQVVETGERVSRGDTVGFVGNTGNARTTPPHLHFGVYKRHHGPVDPFPFVRLVPMEPSEIRANLALAGSVAQAGSDGVRLRRGPSRSADVMDELDASRPFRVVAASGSWYRVRLGDGTEGYVAESVTTDTGAGRVALSPPADADGPESETSLASSPETRGAALRRDGGGDAAGDGSSNTSDARHAKR